MEFDAFQSFFVVFDGKGKRTAVRSRKRISRS